MHRIAHLSERGLDHRPRQSRSLRRGIKIAAALAVATAGTVLAVGPSTASASGSGQIVQTAAGAVKGTVGSDHRVFNGVPYAAPPVGQQRWQPPKPSSSWTKVRDASRPGADCVQTAVAWRPAAASTNEDCLYLNVWTPRQANGGSRLPVAIWFHGGGSVNGAGRDFQPVSMVDQGGMLVVTVNYRLGALGYLTLPQLDKESASGNYGLLDQIQALRWVKDNITRFGGDPTKVMIAGQSAGAGSVCSLLASPRASGLFDTAVIESGGNCAASARADAQQKDAAFVNALGCDTAEVVTCLREKSPSDILNAQQHAGTWGRVIEAGVLPVQPQDAFKTGTFNHVPVLIGGTANEDRAFVYEGNDLVNQPVTAAGYVAAVRAAYGDKASEVLGHYPPADFGNVPGAALAAVQTDSRHSCAELSSASSLTASVPTYVFEFQDETAPVRPYELVPSSFSLATQHSSELPYLWGANTAKPLTSRQRELSRQMIAYWARFARTGSLDPRGLPAVPRYNPTAHQEVTLKSDGAQVTDDMAAHHQCSFWATHS
ncbi:MAG: carboxylesterase/lipase family protein [Actinoallomurus sp.]